MLQLLVKFRTSTVSRLPLAFCFFIAVLFLVLQPVRAQDKTDLASAACVPSELGALIDVEGHTVQVSEAKGEFGGKETASNEAPSSSRASSRLDDRQKEEAYRIFLKEARQGNPAAMVNLAVSSLGGWGTQPNAGAALYWLQAAADRHYGPAFYDLGILYFKGCGVRQDVAKAFHFFDLGASAGHAASQVNLGYFYDHGLGVPQDHAAAAGWYRQAAESGEAQAQYNLADLYLHGEGVPKDESVAFAWFQRAAVQGHSHARIMIGSMLAAGRGTPKDLAAAYLWIFAATLQGDNQGVATLRVLESQLTSAEIQEAKLKAQLLKPAPTADVALLH